MKERKYVPEYESRRVLLCMSPSKNLPGANPKMDWQYFASENSKSHLESVFRKEEDPLWKILR